MLGWMVVLEFTAPKPFVVLMPNTLLPGLFPKKIFATSKSNVPNPMKSGKVAPGPVVKVVRI